MTTTKGMAGGGYYDEHSEHQRAVAATGAALIEECVRVVPQMPDTSTFVIADYGASTGKNSIASVRTAVDAVRKASPTRPVAVLHNDVPTNDWNTLFANLGFTESSLREHLFVPGAVGADAQQRLDEFFGRLEARFAADPEADRFEDWTLTVVVERRA